MKFNTPQISWHNLAPIFSIDFSSSGKFATAGADSAVNIWKLEQDGSVTFLSQLNSQTTAVNIVRFSPDGNYLASSGDDGAVYIWKLDPSNRQVIAFGEKPATDEPVEMKETWVIVNTLSRGNKDVFALAWAPDSSQLITGTIDGIIYLWNLKTTSGARCNEIKDHATPIQGMTFDPLNTYMVSQSVDRVVRIYSKNKSGRKVFCSHLLKSRISDHLIPKLVTGPKKNVRRAIIEEDDEKDTLKTGNQMDIDISPSSTTASNIDHQSSINTIGNQQNNCNSIEETPKQEMKHFRHRLWLDDNIGTFFRRGDWSVDGQILILPCGQYFEKPGSDKECAAYLYTRNNLAVPAAFVLSGKSPSLVVKCSPILYKSSPTNTGSFSTDSAAMKPESLASDFTSPHNFKLLDVPRKYVFAIATEKTVFIYDTEHIHPIAAFADGHYDRMTDLAWSSDGKCLATSNVDGYITFIHFDDRDLGEPLEGEELESAMKAVKEASIFKPRKKKSPKAAGGTNVVGPSKGENEQSVETNNSTEKRLIETEMKNGTDGVELNSNENKQETEDAGEEEEDEEDYEDDDDEGDMLEAIAEGRSIVNLDDDNRSSSSTTAAPTIAAPIIIAKSATRRVAPTILTKPQQPPTQDNGQKMEVDIKIPEPQNVTVSSSNS